MERANKLAEEPELTITAYLTPIYFANNFSNNFTFCHMVVFIFSIESNASHTSSQPYGGTANGILVFVLAAWFFFLTKKCFLIIFFVRLVSF